MKRSRWWMVAAVPFVLVGGLTAVQRLDPKGSSDLLLGLERSRAGLNLERVQVDGYEVAYLDSGPWANRETIVMLHGIGADKDHFTRVSAPLTERYRVISIDLPGFGDSTRTNLPWDIPAQTARLNRIVTTLGLTRFHLGGSSMGGFIALRYAEAHPHDVLSLWLLDPAGVDGVKVTPVVADAAVTGRSALFARNPEDVEAIFTLVFSHPPFLPWSVKQTHTEQMVRDESLHQQIYKAVRASEPVNASAPNIATPTLIVWGDDDRVLDVSGGQVLVKLLPHARLEVMPGLGHLPMLEDPKGCAVSYLKFLNELPKSQL